MLPGGFFNLSRKNEPFREYIIAYIRDYHMTQTQIQCPDQIKAYLDKYAISTVAAMANDMGTGARGLRSIMEKAMRDLMYSATRLAATNKVDGPIVINCDTICGNY